MTDVEFVELRKIAENATPGPWEWAPPSDESWPMEDESLETSWIGEHGYKETVLSGWGHSASGTAAEPQDREFIATFNPERVLELLDRLERAEAALQRVRALADRWNDTPDYKPSVYDEGRVDQRHDMTMQLLVALEGPQ